VSNDAHFDALLGEALECLVEAVQSVRSMPLAPVDENVDKLAIAIEQIWEVRTRLYALKPELKRDLVVESETDPARYQALSEIHQRAARAEGEGNRAEAVALYRKLLDESKFGFFKLCAEAALYRLDGRGTP
jgi:hypothetical protein